MRTELRSLFQPLRIRGVQVPNRVAMCAMNDNLSLPDGTVTEHQIAYYAARAAGGVGLVITGNAFIDDQVSKISGTQLGCHHDAMIPGLARLAESVRGHGAVLVMQLAHAGAQTLPETIQYRQTVGPSGELWVDAPRELTVIEIQEIVTSFAAAARRAERAGFDGVEVHCGHGYLLSAFLSPHVNRRRDDYGGSAENRMRIVREIFERTRAVVGPNFIVGAKLNSSDLVEGGLDEAAGLEVAHALELAGADYLGVSRGVGDSAPAMIAPLYRERHQNVAAARRVKQHVGVPVMAMGAILDAADAERFIADGDADLVAVGRALIADPDWAIKARRGRPQDVRPCIRCNECVELVDTNRELRCAVNPHVGREAAVVPAADRRRRVLVLGGGPAGCEAARTAARRGHEVTLVEQRDRLGGASVPRDNPVFKRELERLPPWYANQLDETGVDVRLGTPATRALVDELDPDVVVYALGADPLQPSFAGLEHPSVVTALELLEEAPAVGPRIALIGAGFVGCETALHLGRAGCHVSLVMRRPRSELASDLNITLRMALLEDLESAGVEVLDERDVERIEPDAVVLRHAHASNGATERLEVDTVVLARGLVGRLVLHDELVAAGYDVRLLGDAKRTGLIFDAVNQGHAVGASV